MTERLLDIDHDSFIKGHYSYFVRLEVSYVESAWVFPSSLPWKDEIEVIATQKYGEKNE